MLNGWSTWLLLGPLAGLPILLERKDRRSGGRGKGETARGRRAQGEELCVDGLGLRLGLWSGELRADGLASCTHAALH